MFTLFLVVTNSDGDERLREFADFDKLEDLVQAARELECSTTEDGWLVSDWSFEAWEKCSECGKLIRPGTAWGYEGDICSKDCWRYFYGEM